MRLALGHSKEKRLEILKDSNSGAFAVIGGCVYFVLSLGIWSEMSLDMLKSAVPVFVLSRALSGLSVVSFPMAKNTGLAAMFSNAAHKRRVRIVMLLWIALTAACMVVINPLTGAAAVLCAAAVFAYYYFMSKEKLRRDHRRFGRIFFAGMRACVYCRMYGNVWNFILNGD